ncbi:MAG: glycosyltransferase [Caldilineaceae bacterium]|nr:glycosyltransferase [Caldilineaceae bacterium]
MLRDLAAYIDREKFDLRFFFLQRGGPYAEELRALGYVVEIIPASNGYDLAMRWSLLKLVRAFDPDIIHEHGVPPLVRPLLRYGTKATLLGFEHGEIEINRRKHKAWLNWLNALEYHLLTTRVVVNSVANGQLVRTTHHLPPARVQVIHLGIDLQKFQIDGIAEVGNEPATLRIGYVGRVQNYDKGTDYLPQLAQTLLQLGFSEFRILVIGDGPDLESVKELSAQLGVADLIAFLGRRSDVPALLQQMDLLVMPSRMEAFGLVAVEALAMSTRVVAFGVPGLAEVLAGCPAARLVPPGDIQAFAHAVLALWQTYGKQRSTEARRYVADHFDARRMTAELEQCYRAYRR